jgi:hypothetical protein
VKVIKFYFIRSIHDAKINIERINLSKAQWLVPIVPATWEAGTGGLLEPKRSRLALAHSKNLTKTNKKEKERKTKDKLTIYFTFPHRFTADFS